MFSQLRHASTLCYTRANFPDDSVTPPNEYLQENVPEDTPISNDVLNFTPTMQIGPMDFSNYLREKYPQLV